MKMFWKLSLVFVVTLLIKGYDCQPPACGRAPLNTKIVGGVNASAGAWPWQVSLHADGSHFCGGSLINNQWVLSAAHCFPGNSDATANSITVYLGRQSQELSNPNEVSRNVSRIIVHPDYGKGQSYNNDMALLQLSSPVNFTNYIGPVCLAAEGSTFNNDTMWVTGWGTIYSGVSLPSPQILQEVDVPLVGNSKCNCLYDGAITDNMMCAGLPEGGKDSCQGDSGGPMVIKQGSTWIQAGVVSFGNGCAQSEYPGVYARVSQYQQWIRDQIGPDRAGFVPFNSTTPPQDEIVNCPTKPTVCGGEGSWPWMATLAYNGYPMCVGTLVSERFVMTSASCFSRFMGVDRWTVSFNVVQWDCSSYTMSSGVANVFSEVIYGNGVALVEVSNPFYYTPNIPVDMYDLSFGPGTPCSAVHLNLGLGQSFQEVQTTIVNCDHSDTSVINICTEPLPLSFQQNDNGIPLLCRMSDMWIQVGLLSVNPGSDMNSQSSNSTVFIRTSPFANFLTNTIRDSSIWGGVGSFSPLSLTSILLLSFPAILLAIY